MRKVTQLWIRACKSRNPRKRVDTLYKRFYYVDNDYNNIRKGIISILSQIHDKYCKIDTLKMIDAVSKDGLYWRFSSKPYDYHEAVLEYLISKIRLSEKDRFPGLTPPRKFR